MLCLKKYPLTGLICLALVQLTTTAPQPRQVIKLLPISQQQFASLTNGRGYETPAATGTNLKKSIGSTWQTLLNRTGLLAYKPASSEHPPKKPSVSPSSISEGYPLCVIKTGAGEGRAAQRNHGNERPIVNCVVVASMPGKPVEDIDYNTSEQDVEENVDEDPVPSTDEPPKEEDPQTNMEASSVALEGAQEISGGSNQTESVSSDSDSSSVTQKNDGEEQTMIVARLPTPYYPQPYPSYGLRMSYGSSQSYPGYSTYSASPSSSSKRDYLHGAPFYGFTNPPLPSVYPPFSGYPFPAPYPIPPSGYAGGYPSFSPYHPAGPVGFPQHFGPALSPHNPAPGFPLNLPYSSKFPPSLLLGRNSPLTAVAVKGLFNGKVQSQKGQEEGEEINNYEY